MTIPTKQIQALVLAALMVLSAFAGVAAAAGTSATVDSNDNSTDSQEAQVDNGSAKALTISWFRDDGDANGPYPVMPSEYEDDEAGMVLFTNAEGDAQLRVDNSTARNPNGQWDMLTLHVETTGLDQLNPPTAGEDRGLVTQNFIENDDWNVDISQVGGDKTLSVAENQNGYENPEGTDSDIPPVMVFADTEEIDSDFTYGEDPDSGLFVWVDPNRAVLDENGNEVSFEPGEEYEVTFEINGQTETTTFEMVEGDVSLNDSYEPANKFGAEISGDTTLAAGSEVQLVLETGDGDTMTETVEVDGNEVLMGSDSAGTIPEGAVTGAFDLSGMQGQDFTLTAYAPGPEGGLIDGEPARDDDDYFEEGNRIQVAQSSGTIQDIIDPDYTIEETNLSDGKALSLPYGIDDYSTPTEIANSVGDGEVAQDPSVAYDPQGTEAWDGMWLHFETSDSIFEAIDRSPGQNIHSKFDSSPLSLEIVQTNADGEPARLNMSRNANGTAIIPDPGQADERLYNSQENGLFFWLDMNNVVLYRNGEPVEPEPGMTFEATLTIETENGVEEETIEFELVEGESWVGQERDETVEIPQSENAEINLNTELAAGGEWTIEVESEDGSIDASTEDNVPAGDSEILAGKIAGAVPTASTVMTVDTSELDYDTELTIRAYLEEDPPDSPHQVVETTGVIVPPPTGSISFSAQSGNGESVTVDEVELSDGGFVSVHTGSATGPTIGASDYLDEGSHSDVEIDLDESVDEDTTLYVVAHEDTNGNEAFDFPSADEPYTADGSTVTAEGDFTFEASSDDGDDGDDGETTETSGEDGETDNESGTPGFGVGVALIALVSAALVAAYRRD